MAAFVFAHVKFFGADFLYNYLLLGLMFPAATAILPLFIKVMPVDYKLALARLAKEREAAVSKRLSAVLQDC